MTTHPDGRPTAKELLAGAELLARHGGRVVRLHHPLPDGGCSCGDPDHRADVPKTSCGKHPNLGKGWQTKATSDPAVIAGWWKAEPLSNVGLLLNPDAGMIGIDIDSAAGERIVADLAGGDLPPTWEFSTGHGRRLLFRVPPGVSPKVASLKDANGDEAVRFQCGKNSQTAAPPSWHYSGRRYEWAPGRDPDSLPLADMPGWLLAVVCPPELPPAERRAGRADHDPDAPWADFNRRGSWGEVLTQAGFKFSSKAAGGVSYWTRPGKGGGTSVSVGHYKSDLDGTDLLFAFSGSIPFLDPWKPCDLFGFYARWRHNGDFSAAAKALRDDGFDGVRYGRPAKAARPGAAPPLLPPPPPPAAGGGQQPGGTVDPCSDLANGRRFAAEHADDARYSHPEKRWYVWTGNRWRHDDTGAAVRMAKATAARMLRAATEAMIAAAGDPHATAEAARGLKWAVGTQQANRLEAMLKLAQSEPGLAVTPDQFDADPWLFNCPNGTLDLRTGELRPHRREDHQTALCPTPFDPAARCPAWERFTATVFGGDAEMVAYVRRLLGYAATGNTSVAVLPVLWGDGSNGKSTLVETVLDVLGGDYATKAPPDFLMAKKGENHPTELADLKGKRLVVAMETEEGRRLNEPLIKELTGGDRIKARRMREDFWEFKPTHKLFLGTNYKPAVRTGGHGLWRRLRLIPFAVRFWRADEGEAGPPELEADRTLRDKLTAEAAGILAWVVRGCLAWQRAGRDLATPKPVIRATTEYREEEDIFGRFFADRCERHHTAVTASADAYAAFLAWCEQERANERPLSQTIFGKRLTAAGMHKHTSNGKVVYTGFRLRRLTPPERVERGFEADFGINGSRERNEEVNPKTALNPLSTLSGHPVWQDAERFFDLMGGAGLQWSQVVAWLNDQHDAGIPKDAGLFDVLTAHRKLAAEWLAGRQKGRG